MGRFNFTFLAEHGRITGMVRVPTENRSKPEIEKAAHDKIRALAAELAAASGSPEPLSSDGAAE